MSDSDLSGSDFSDEEESFSRSKHDFEANSEAEEVDVSNNLLVAKPILFLVLNSY